MQFISGMQSGANEILTLEAGQTLQLALIVPIES